MDSPSTARSYSSPDLFHDCVAAWGACIAAPTSANLRALARKGLLSEQADSQRILTLPVSFADIINVFLKNKDIMLEMFQDDPGIPYHISALELYKEHFQDLDQPKLVVFDDERSEEELVYGIIVNAEKKKTTLTFRGSVSKRDYEADFNVLMRTMEDQQGQTVGVHAGFSEYLFGTDKRGSNNNAESKFDEILDNLRSLMEQYPDHQLYVTGHSLGGSLALLAASRLATIDDIVRSAGGVPVKVFGFGAMLVGDLRFLRSFQELERRGRIRSVVFMNKGDIIPLLPFSSGCVYYRSAGKRVLLFQDPRRPIVYSPPEFCMFNKMCFCLSCCLNIPGPMCFRFAFILCCRRRFWQHHTVSATMENLAAAESHLKNMTLEGLYERHPTSGRSTSAAS